jgi:hypothetical protein
MMRAAIIGHGEVGPGGGLDGGTAGRSGMRGGDAGGREGDGGGGGPRDTHLLA